jgi:hypothetical protein
MKLLILMDTAGLTYIFVIRFEVQIVVKIKVMVFQDVMLCS